jgi:hypothetical protein
MHELLKKREEGKIGGSCGGDSGGRKTGVPRVPDAVALREFRQVGSWVSNVSFLPIPSNQNGRMHGRIFLKHPL